MFVVLIFHLIDNRPALEIDCKCIQVEKAKPWTFSPVFLFSHPLGKAVKAAGSKSQDFQPLGECTRGD